MPYEGEFCDSILDDVDYHCDNYIAPTVTFYSNNADLCSIDMNAGKSAAQSCLNQIKAHNADWYVNIVHGFGGNDENEWMTEIKLALLNRYATRNVLVGVVDWRRGADRLNLNNFFDENDYGKKRSVPRITDNTTNEEVGQEMRDGLLLERGSGCFLSEVFDKIYENYYKSAADTPIVGRFLGLLTKQIKEDNTHIKTFCIGHSLGAHVCGFSGKTLGDNVVDGIIGMDAAGPIFEVNSAKARLNINDAKKVQLFHTNYEFLGIEKPVGNFDIYVNGGSYQHCGGVVSLCSHSAYLLVIQLLEGNGHCDTSKGTMILADLDDLTPDTGSALLYTDVNGGSCYVEDWVCRGDELCCWRGECREGEGDCNMDRDCKGDLVCGSNNCPWDTDKTWLLNFRDDCCKVHTNQGTNVINTVIDTVIAHVDCLLTLSRHNCKGPDCKWVGFFWNFGICHNF